MDLKKRKGLSLKGWLWLLGSLGCLGTMIEFPREEFGGVGRVNKVGN